MDGRLETVKPQQQRKAVKPRQKARGKAVKTAKHSAGTESGFGVLYSRLNRTQPGSKESKQIADEIIDAIG